MPRTPRRAATAFLSGLLVLAVAACTSDPDPVPSPPTVTTLPTETPSAQPSPTTPVGSPTTGETGKPTDDATTEAPSDATTDEPPTIPPPSAGVTAVTVTTSYWGFDRDSGSAFANGYANVVDQGGRCTLSLTKGSLTAMAQTNATADATTTACGEITVPGSELSPGTWQAVISYASPSSSGQSDPVEIVVP